MKKIKRDFMARELGSLALPVVFIAAILTWLIFYAQISPFWLFGIPLIVIAFVLRMYWQTAYRFRRTCEQFSESWQDRVGKEYSETHPIYPVAYGEIHLMKTCIICRNRRRCLCLPVEQIIQVEEKCYRVGVKRIPILKFKLDTDRSVQIDFSIKHSKEVEHVLSWLIGQIGTEKVNQISY